MTLLIRWTCCPPQGAHTSHLRTLSKIEFLLSVSAFASRTFRPREPPTIQPFSKPSTPFLKIYFEKFCRDSAPRSRQRRHQSKGGESYIRFPFRQHLRSNFFASICRHPEGSPFVALHRFGSHDEGGRILHPIPDSSTPVRNFIFRTSSCASMLIRRSSAHGRTNACRSAANALHRRLANDPGPRLPRHQYAKHAH